MKTVKQDIGRRISAIKIRLLHTAPFFGAIACDLNWLPDDSIPTACTDGRSIWFNPTFMDSLTDQQLIAVAAHEVLHVAKKHMLRIGSRNPQVWNYATDYVINAEIDSSDPKIGELPTDCLLDQQFAGKLEERVYEELLKNAKKIKASATGCIGDVKAPQGATPADMDKLSRQIDRSVSRAIQIAKQAGKLPGYLECYDPADKKVQVNWRQELAAFLQPLLPTDSTWNRLNRRMFPQGIYAPGVTKDGIGKLAVAIDTSGSISKNTIDHFVSEINGLISDCNPEQVDIGYFTTEIYRTDTFHCGEEFTTPDKVQCGGTDFRPITRWSDPLGVKALIVLTDLYAEFPQQPGYPVLWIATTDETAPFGKTIKIDLDREDW